MNRMVVKSKICSDGMLHLHLPLGQAAADKDVQITVEPIAVPSGTLPTMSAADLLHSDLVGIWANRPEIGDSRAFARRLREQAQTWNHDA
jgi:hypothetical protein